MRKSTGVFVAVHYKCTVTADKLSHFFQESKEVLWTLGKMHDGIMGPPMNPLDYKKYKVGESLWTNGGSTKLEKISGSTRPFL